MKYKRLFNDLRQYVSETPNVSLKQYKAIVSIIWNNMSPTEQDLFQDLYEYSTEYTTSQLNIKRALYHMSKIKEL
jgi:hypothetical protein